MLVGDLIYSDSFDANCNYAIYNCRDGKQWREAPVLFSTLKTATESRSTKSSTCMSDTLRYQTTYSLSRRSKERKRKSGIQAFFFVLNKFLCEERSSSRLFVTVSLMTASSICCRIAPIFFPGFRPSSFIRSFPLTARSFKEKHVSSATNSSRIFNTSGISVNQFLGGSDGKMWSSKSAFFKTAQSSRKSAP